MSHNRRVLSQEPDNANIPSDDIVTSDTMSLWPTSELFGTPKFVPSIVSCHTTIDLSIKTYSNQHGNSQLQ